MAKKAGKPRMTPTERRRQLLDAALGLFARRPFEQVDLALIAETAGTTEKVASRHFADVNAVVAAITDELRQSLFAIDDAPSPVSAQDRFQEMIDAFRTQLRSAASPVRVVLKLLPEAPAVMRAGLAQLTMDAANLILAGQQEGVFRRILDPHRSAWELVRSLFGHALLRAFQPIMANPDPDEAPISFDAFLHGLLKTDV